MTKITLVPADWYKILVEGAVFCEQYGIKVSADTVKTALGKEWANDALIQVMSEWWAEQHPGQVCCYRKGLRGASGLDKTLIMPVEFWEVLTRRDATRWTEGKAKERVVKLESYSRIIIYMNVHKIHYMVGCINIASKRTEMYDSMMAGKGVGYYQVFHKHMQK
jgi:Ulp1 family protease